MRSALTAGTDTANKTKGKNMAYPMNPKNKDNIVLKILVGGVLLMTAGAFFAYKIVSDAFSELLSDSDKER